MSTAHDPLVNPGIRPNFSEETGFTRYNWLLLAILSSAGFFEGYDFMIINSVLRFVGVEFGMPTELVGIGVSIVAFGTVIAFPVIWLGDRIGRKNLLIGSVALYTVGTVMSGFSQYFADYVGWQCFTRIFLTAEWTTASVIAAEEFPARHRAFGIGVLQGVAGLGSIFSAVLLPVMFDSPFGWRGMYFVGILPLLIVTVLRLRLRETTRFQAIKAQRHQVVTSRLAYLLEVFQPRYRRGIVLVMLVWFLMYLGYTAVQSFWAYFAVNERGWTADMVSAAMAVSYTLGMAGFPAAGKMMDVVGRKVTGLIFLVGGAACAVWAFNAHGTMMNVSLLFLTFFTCGFLPFCTTLSTELFPTEIRARAQAWTNNTLGRVGMVIAPALVGFLSLRLGSVSLAVSALAIGPVLAAVLVAVFLPETRRKPLEAIQPA